MARSRALVTGASRGIGKGIRNFKDATAKEGAEKAEKS